MTTKTVSLQDILDEITTRDEVIEELVKKYFILEALAQELKTENAKLKRRLGYPEAIDKYQEANRKNSVHSVAISV